MTHCKRISCSSGVDDMALDNSHPELFHLNILLVNSETGHKTISTKSDDNATDLFIRLLQNGEALGSSDMWRGRHRVSVTFGSGQVRVQSLSLDLVDQQVVDQVQGVLLGQLVGERRGVEADRQA